MPVYQYEGVHYDLPDGLSNEQAIAKIETHLGKSQTPTTEIGNGEGFLDKAVGAGQAAATAITGSVGALTGWIPAAMQKMNDPKNVDFEKQYAANMGAMTYEPSRERGQDYANIVGDIANDYLIPGAMAMQGLPQLAPASAMLGAIGENMGRFKKAPIKPTSAIEAAKAALNEPEIPTSARPPSTAPIGDAIAQMRQQLGGAEPEPFAEGVRTPTRDVAQSLLDRESNASSALDEQRQRTQGVNEADADIAAKERQDAAQKATEQRNGNIDAEMQQRLAEEARVSQEAQWREQASKGTQSDTLLAEQEARKQAIEDAARAADQPPIEQPKGKTTLESGIELSIGPDGRLSFKPVEPVPIEPLKPTTMETAVDKVSNGQQFAMSAEERVVWEKTRKAVESLGDRLRRLTNKEIISKIQDRAWVQDAVNKIKQQRAMFDDIAKRSRDHMAVNQAIKKRQLLDDHLQALEDSLGARVDNSPKTQGPKTKAAKAAEGIGKKSQKGGLLIDWGSKNKTSGIGGPVGDMLKDIGNALIKTPEEAIKFARTAADVSQNTLQKGINLFTKGGTYLKAKVNNPVVHFAVDRFLDADGKAKAEISQILHAEYLPALRDLTDQQRIDAFELLNTADLNQKKLTPEFMTKHGVDKTTQDFIMTHQKAMESAISKINAARATIGKKPINAREAYSAISISGDYRKVVYKTINGEKQVVGVISSNSRNSKFGSNLTKIQEEIAKKDPTLEFGPLQDMTKRKSTSDGSPNAAFHDALETIGENNPHVQDFLNTLKEVAKDDAKNYLGMQTHTMQKKGVWGMEGRKQWLSPKENMEAFFHNQSQYLEGVTRWSHLAEAARDVNEVIRNKDVIDKHQNAIKLTEDYMHNALGLNPSEVGKGIEKVFNSIFSSDIADRAGLSPSRMREGIRLGKMGINTSLLSLNPSFLGIQLIQGGASMPAMTALLHSRGLAPTRSALVGGLDAMAKAGMTYAKSKIDNGSGLSAVEKGALKFAKDNHIYATDMVEHANQIDKGFAYKATKVSQSPAAVAEIATRAQVYMAFVHMMNESGLKPEQGLYEQAHRMTDMAMNNYGALEKPPIYNALGPLGSMAYNLKSFGHNEISRWSMFAREAKNNGVYAPLLTQMATTIVVAGVMGLPFYSQWEQLYDLITAKLGEPKNLTLDVLDASKKLGEHIPQVGEYFLSHGAPSLLGMDISKRVGLGDVLPNKASDVAFAGGSKAGDLVGNVAGVISKPDEAHAKALALSVAPPILQNFLKDSWYTKGDLSYSMNPDKPTVATAQLNPTDKILKKIGITGVNESVQKEKYYQNNKLEQTYKEIKDKGLTRMSQDIFSGKPISDTAINLYMKGQGDPSQIQDNLLRMAKAQGMSQNQIKILMDGSSKSITKMHDLERRTQ
jgi:hypothetical protein